MSSPAPPAAQTLTIETGSIFVFDAVLTPVMGVASQLEDKMRQAGDAAELMLETHPAVSEAIDNAQASRIFGDCSGIKAFRAEHRSGAVAVGLQRDPAALSGTEAVVFAVEDARLSRTLLLSGLNIQLHDVSADEVIAVIQSAGATAERSDSAARPMLSVALGDLHERTLGDVLEQLRSNLIAVVENVGNDVTFESRNWCCEIRKVGRYATAAHLLDDDIAARPLYGLLYGDEGWEFVPEEHADQELARFWGSRDYVAVLAQETGLVVLNLEERRVQDRAHGEKIARELSGLTLPQLGLGASSRPVAGIDHVALFAFQRSVLRLLAAKELESRLFRASKSVARPRGLGARLLGWLRSLLGGIPAVFRVLYRGAESRFYKDLLRVSGGSVTEIAKLQSFVDERVGATPLLQRLSRAADLVDIELRDRRLTALNWLVVLLTLLTVAIAVLEFVLK